MATVTRPVEGGGDGFGARLRSVAGELHGRDLGAFLARIGTRPRSWYNYVNGVAMPHRVLLRFLVETGVSPAWLLTGEGERFTRPPSPV